MRSARGQGMSHPYDGIHSLNKFLYNPLLPPVHTSNKSAHFVTKRRWKHHTLNTFKFHYILFILYFEILVLWWIILLIVRANILIMSEKRIEW